ncbi:protein lin-54 homolog [Clavelina lepadiformis]|uniref:protein lin-54 homolog n=1 Tax=Clavelina lepadiformis TaxID=159417 RepID=UPI004041963E
MEAFERAPPESLQDLLDLDTSNPENIEKMDISENNVHDDTDDALETMLMEEDDNIRSQEAVVSSADVIDAQPVLNSPMQHTTMNTPQNKMVTVSQPIQVLTQQKLGTSGVVTKFIVKKTATSAAKTNHAVLATTGTTQTKTTTGLQTITLGNNLTLSPIKGGFKIPISPLKNSSLKVSMIPASSSSTSNTLRTINFNKLVGGSRQQVQAKSNFQFQTLAPNHRVSVSNIQRFPQNVVVQQPQQLQVPAQRLQCVRLMPTANASNGSVAGISNVIATQASSTLPIGTAVLQTQRVQPFINIQTAPNTMQTLQSQVQVQTTPVQQQKPVHQRLIMPATSLQLNQPVANISPGTVLQSGNMGYAMVPAKYVEQLKKQLSGQMFQQNNETSSSPTSEASNLSIQQGNLKVPMNGKIRKPCNCTKSMCLKLYCECFANGHFCDGCNCINCHNNLEFDGDRSKAIKSCLERNPMAFRPKIGRGRDDNRTHQKGCNCKRSGCLKNYCECYEARIPCTSKCKCIGCKNIEGESTANLEQHSLMNLADAAAVRCQQQAAARSRISTQIGEIRSVRPKPQISQSLANERLPYTFFTQEVIEATCTCLLAQAEEAEKTNRSIPVAEMMILEEFGRCLMQIIQAASKAKTVSHAGT